MTNGLDHGERIPIPPPPLLPATFLSRYLSYMYSGTSLTRNSTTLGPYSRPMPRFLGGSEGGGRFLMGKVPLYTISGGGHGDPGCANDRVCDLLNPEIHARLDRG